MRKTIFSTEAYVKQSVIFCIFPQGIENKYKESNFKYFYFFFLLNIISLYAANAIIRLIIAFILTHFIKPH